MQASNQKGTVSSFFTYWDGPNWTHDEWNEIDVEIVPSKKDTPFSFMTVTKEKTYDQEYAFNWNPVDGWNTYVVELKPDSVSWFINGIKVKQIADSPTAHFLNKP